MSRVFLTAIIFLAILALVPKRASAAAIIQRPLYVGLGNGLTGLYSFDGQDVSGSRVFDRSLQANHATLSNGAARALGKVGQGIIFDGSNDRLAASTDTVGTGADSISVWMKPKSLGRGRLARFSTTAPPNSFFRLRTSSRLHPHLPSPTRCHARATSARSTAPQIPVPNP